LKRIPSEEPETGTSKSKDTFGKGGVSNIFGSPPSSKKKAGFDGNPTDLFSDLMASSKATKSAPKKKSVFDDLGLSDDDDDLFVSSTGPSTAPASKPKAAATKPKASTNTTSSSAAKGKAKQTKKPAKPADDDSDEEMVEAEMASSTPKPARTCSQQSWPQVLCFDSQ
jgi:hypothetical protein